MDVHLLTAGIDQALSSFSTMIKTLDPAQVEDIQQYKTWIEKHALIEQNETQFLERKNDLLALSRRRSARDVGGVGLTQSAAIGLPVILVLLLMAFAMIPGLLGRLFVIVLIGTAAATVVTSTEQLMGLMTVKEWIACASM